MCHRWLLGFVVNSVGSSLVFFSYVGWICGLVIWCHFGEIRKDVPKNTQDLANWPRRLRRLSLALMAEVGNCQWNAELNRLLADFGRPFLVHAVVWYVLFVGILSGHKWKSHPARVLLNTPHWLQIATQATSESSPFLLVGKELLQYVHA